MSHPVRVVRETRTTPVPVRHPCRPVVCRDDRLTACRGRASYARRGSNPRPSDYKSDALRRAGGRGAEDARVQQVRPGRGSAPDPWRPVLGLDRPRMRAVLARPARNGTSSAIHARFRTSLLRRAFNQAELRALGYTARRTSSEKTVSDALGGRRLRTRLDRVKGSPGESVTTPPDGRRRDARFVDFGKIRHQPWFGCVRVGTVRPRVCAVSATRGVPRRVGRLVRPRDGEGVPYEASRDCRSDRGRVRRSDGICRRRHMRGCHSRDIGGDNSRHSDTALRHSQLRVVPRHARSTASWSSTTTESRATGRAWHPSRSRDTGRPGAFHKAPSTICPRHLRLAARGTGKGLPVRRHETVCALATGVPGRPPVASRFRVPPSFNSGIHGHLNGAAARHSGIRSFSVCARRRRRRRSRPRAPATTSSCDGWLTEVGRDASAAPPGERRPGRSEERA